MADVSLPEGFDTHMGSPDKMLSDVVMRVEKLVDRLEGMIKDLDKRERRN